MPLTSAPPTPVLTYHVDPGELQRARRFWVSGAVFALVGLSLFMLIARYTLRSGVGAFLHRIWYALCVVHDPRHALSLLLLVTTALDAIGGVVLIVFPMRWRRLLMATLAVQSVLHLSCIIVGVIFISNDPWSGARRGYLTIEGLVLAVPSMALFVCGVVAFVRIIRLPRASN